MKINFNGKQTLIIVVSSAASGATILGIGKAITVLKQKRAKKKLDSIPVVSGSEEKSEEESEK